MANDDLNSCRELAAVCDRILASDPAITPVDFLRSLGSLVAGIDPGPEGLLDLARGGSNEIWGKGFLPEFDDGSRGQARHFAGTAASVAIVGGRLTEFVAHTLLDSADSPDGRLTSMAVEFATQVLEETLPLQECSEWIQEHLCLPGTRESAIRIEPAPPP